MTKTTSNITGHIDNIEGNLITGWAVDASAVDASLRLQIIDNGELLGQVEANKYRADLKHAGFGDGHHGFEFVVPGGLSPMKFHTIQVQLAEDGRDVQNCACVVAAVRGQAASPVTVSAQTREVCRGSVDDSSRKRLRGWAHDDLSPNVPVALLIFDNGVEIARVTANLYRPDLERLGVGTGWHGFDIFFSGGLAPVANHVIQIKRERDGAELSGSPVFFDSLDSEFGQSIANALALSMPDGREEILLSIMLSHVEQMRQRYLDSDARLASLPLDGQAHMRGTSGQAASASRALVVSERVPAVDRDADSKMILSHIAALQRLGYAVSFVAADEMAPPDAAVGLLAAAGIGRRGAPFYASVEEVLRRKVDSVEVVYLNGVGVAARYLTLVRTYAPEACILYNVAHLRHAQLERQAALDDRSDLLAASRRMRVAELSAAWAADVVITHSIKELEILRNMLPKANLHRVPWDVPLRDLRSPFSKRHGLAFIGHYGHPHNRDAARWLVEAVMPLVWQTDPSIHCKLAGSEMPRSLWRLARPGVTIVGHVSDLGEAVFNEVRLTVAPMRYSGGLSGKVLESLASGVPCVMSEIVARDLALPPELQELVGSDATSLARLICTFHAEPLANQAAASAGVALIQKGFNPNTVSEALQEALESAYNTRIRAS